MRRAGRLAISVAAPLAAAARSRSGALRQPVLLAAGCSGGLKSRHSMATPRDTGIRGDATGKRRSWDVATRTTRPGDDGAGCDAVAILALLRRGGDSVDTLLVQQYRPPVDAVTVELPAELIDEGETAEEAALRELRGDRVRGICGLSSGVVATKARPHR